jgi:glycosyltransferase involved in cell wall biosynthesis
VDHYGFVAFREITTPKAPNLVSSSDGEKRSLTKASGFILNARLMSRTNRLAKGLGYLASAMYGNSQKFNQILDKSIHKSYNVFNFLHQSRRKGKFSPTPKGLILHRHLSEDLKPINSPFRDGDVVLTCGLDWEYSVMEKFKSIQNHQNLNLVSIIYDMIPIINPEYIQDSRYVNRLLGHFTLIAELSSLVLLNTVETELRFKEFCQKIGVEAPPTRIVPWGAGIDQSIGSIEVSGVLDKVNERGFLLAVGTLEIRKNYELLLRIVQLARERNVEIPHFVFVGMAGWDTTDLIKQLQSNEKLSGYITWLTDVDDGELRWLYENCEGLLSPSFSEGYGLPVGEAKLFSKQTYLSDIAVYRELFPDSIFLSPNDPAAWLDAIANSKTSFPLTWEPRTWEQASQEVADAIGQFFDFEIKCYARQSVQ